MDYKQHKGSLRGKIKDKTERKLYNKRIREDGKNIDESTSNLDLNDIIFCTCGEKSCINNTTNKCINCGKDCER